MEYLCWNITPERHKHEWMRLRHKMVRFRLGLVIGGHLIYFAFCAVANHHGKIQNFRHAIWVGFWTLFLFSLVLLLSEFIYARMRPGWLPRFAIRKNGVTKYGQDGPAAHYDWRRKRLLRIESDPRHAEFRSLVLCERSRFKWLREASRVIIPLPQAGDEIDEFDVVEALQHAIEDAGLVWRAAADGTMMIVG